MVESKVKDKYDQLQKEFRELQLERKGDHLREVTRKARRSLLLFAFISIAWCTGFKCAIWRLLGSKSLFQ